MCIPLLANSETSYIFFLENLKSVPKVLGSVKARSIAVGLGKLQSSTMTVAGETSTNGSLRKLYTIGKGDGGLIVIAFFCLPRF